MLEFKPITLSDIDIIEPYFKEKNSRFCDYSIGGRFMWREYFKMEYIIVKETLIFKNVDEGEVFFELPIGKNWLQAFAFIWDYCKEHQLCPKFAILNNDDVEVLKKYFFRTRQSYERGWSDYLYDAQAFKEFKGKRYNKKRNHLNAFRQNNSYSVERISDDNIKELIVYFEDYQTRHSKDSEVYLEENKRVLEVLNDLETFKMQGIILRVNQQIVAFSLGEIIGETLFCHIEKAEMNIRGAYQMVAYSFAREFVDDKIKWINREEDTNDMGLRQSKYSYKPNKILNKYMLEVLPSENQALCC